MSLRLDDATERLQNLTLYGTEQVKKLGIDRAKFVCVASKLIRLVSENGEFTLANTLDSKKIAVLVQHANKKGTASTNSESEEDLLSSIKQARDLASFSVEDKFLTMANADLAPTVDENISLYDDMVAGVSIDELKDAVAPVIDDLLSDDRVEVERFEISASIGLHHLANTLGVRQKELQSSIDWDFVGMATEGEQVSGIDYDSGFSFKRENFADKMRLDAEKFKQRVLQSLDPRPSPSYKGLIIVSPRALDDLMLDPMLYHMSGYSIMDGKSKWADSLDKAVASSSFSMWDDPTDIELEGATTYDADGLPTKRMELVKDGVLLNHLWDCYSANRTGKQPNAMAGGPFGLQVAAGPDSLADFLKARKEIILLERFSGNVDPLTGDFSGVAKSSSLYVDGERACPVSETMVAGNAFDLMQQITGISREVDNVSGDYKAPYLLVDGISVSAKS